MSGIISDNTGRASGLLKSASVEVDWVKVYGTDTPTSAATEHDYNGYFTSTYKVYKIYIDTEGSAAGNSWVVRFASTGSYTYDTGGNYKYAFKWVSNTSEGQSGDSDSFIRNGWNGGGSSATGVRTEMTLFNPTQTAHKKMCHFQSQGWDGSPFFSSTAGGIWENTAAITGVRFYSGAGNTLVRSIYIYGLKA